MMIFGGRAFQATRTASVKGLEQGHNCSKNSKTVDPSRGCKRVVGRERRVRIGGHSAGHKDLVGFFSK
jgi:hypothetical protein